MRGSHLSDTVFTLTLAFVSGWATAPVVAAWTFDDGASIEAWTFSNGPEFPGATGRITWSEAEGHARPGAMALHYSFQGGGNYVQATVGVPAGSDPRGVRLWLRKAAANRITFRAMDAGGQVLQKSVDYSADGWQQIEVGLTSWTGWYGGANDGNVKFPVRQFGILVENSSPQRDGVLYVDDVELLKETGSAQLMSWYSILDPRLHASGGEGNRFADGTWTYNFGDGRTVRLRGGYSLLGHPRALRLVVQGDGSGHTLHVDIGSHFQNFTRELGRLTVKGRQALEIPMGDMKGWQFSGGENNGRPQLPLRFFGLRMEKTGEPASGSIVIESMEARTTYDADVAAAVIPSVQSEGERADFGVVLRNLRPAAVKGRLTCEIRTLAERVAQHTEELTLPAAAVPVARSYTGKLGGNQFLDATFRWNDAECSPRATSAGVALAPEGEGSARPDPASAVGAGLYLYRWNGHPQARENMDRMAALARRAGVKWSREEIQWHATEPAEGQFDWAFYDTLLDVAGNHGISVYGLLAYWSNWSKSYTPEGVEQYCRWARQVVRRYKDRIHHWEVWNEPNIFFWSGEKELYAKLLTAAYEAIKAEDPDAVVMGCSTAGIDTNFIRKVMEWGGRFDALTIHPYRGVFDDLQYMRELRDVRELVGGRPVWITEIGFPSQIVTGYSDRNQASLVARVYLASLASNAIANVSWYDFRNDGDDPFYAEHNFGLVRHDFRIKPAYRSLATLGRLLEGRRLKGPVDVGEGAYAFRFGGAAGDVVAIGAPEAARLLALADAQGLNVVNAMGEPVAPVRVGGRSVITLDAGFPVYLSGPAEFAVDAAPASLTLTAETSHPRAGARVNLRFPHDVSVAKWEVPGGWSPPVKVDDGLYVLTVPGDAPSGTVTIQAFVDLGGILRLPLNLRVAPAVLRI